jgi:MFS transporter, OCT family, solute carrier family 22 (organic cation transporter), member 4/5
MICSEFENQVPILQSMLFFGALIGFFVIPNIADNSGRKGALRLAWIIGIISVAMTMLADSPRIIGFGLFFIGFGTNPAITLAFSFINEQSLGKSRQRFGVGVQLGLALGESTIALIFLSDMSWRTIMMILLILFVAAYLPLEIFLKESPMYLIEKSPHLTLKLLN